MNQDSGNGKVDKVELVIMETETNIEHSSIVEIPSEQVERDSKPLQSANRSCDRELVDAGAQYGALDRSTESKLNRFENTSALNSRTIARRTRANVRQARILTLADKVCQADHIVHESIIRTYIYDGAYQGLLDTGAQCSTIVKSLGDKMGISSAITATERSVRSMSGMWLRA